MTEQKLLMCPFCGSEAKYEYRPDDESSGMVETLGCTNVECHIRLIPQYYSRGLLKDQMYTMWNKRTDSPSQHKNTVAYWFSCVDLNNRLVQWSSIDHTDHFPLDQWKKFSVEPLCINESTARPLKDTL